MNTTKEDFFKLAKNRNKYVVINKIPFGTLNYADKGDRYNSDTLYDAGYNINELVSEGYLQLVPRIFDFEKELVGKNVHSVLSVCPECGSHGINFPLDKECGNCGYSETITYYDAETINNLLNKHQQ